MNAVVEQVLVVSARNVPLGSMPRNLLRQQRKTYRASFIYVFSQQRQELLVQKRTMLKDSNPGCFDLSLGGVFAPDESPLLNATRELKEELNLPTEGDQFTFTFAGSIPY